MESLEEIFQKKLCLFCVEPKVQMDFWEIILSLYSLFRHQKGITSVCVCVCVCVCVQYKGVVLRLQWDISQLRSTVSDEECEEDSVIGAIEDTNSFP